MAAPRFNLVDEPWIRCIDYGGARRTLSLCDTLLQAHELREISDRPPVTAALTRLLAALAHRVLEGPATPEAWGDAWDRGRFDPAAVIGYFGSWRPYFDLFDAELPFFQSRLDRAKLLPPAALDPALATGHNPTLFDHSTTAKAAPIPAAEAARLLVALQAFAAGGLVSGEAGGRTSAAAAPVSGSWVFIATGPTLFHTLLLNTPVYDPDAEKPFAPMGVDRPVWERKTVIEQCERPPAGWLDLLTYPSRRVWLLPDPSAPAWPAVTGVAITDGNRPGTGWEPRGRDIALAFKATKAKGWSPLRPFEGRDLWRDADVLFVGHSAEAAKPPVLEHVAAMLDRGLIDVDLPLGLDACALATDKAKYLFWRQQRLSARAGILRSDAAADLIAGALAAAHNVAAEMRAGVALLAGPQGGANLDSKARERLQLWMDHAMGEFWAPLAVGFAALLNDLADERSALSGWSACLVDAVARAWDSWESTVPHSPAGFRRIARATGHRGRAMAAAHAIGEIAP